MTKIYACLIGNWVCLNDDPECKMGPNQVSPLVWWEEMLIFTPHLHEDLQILFMNSLI